MSLMIQMCVCVCVCVCVEAELTAVAAASRLLHSCSQLPLLVLSQLLLLFLSTTPV